MSQDPRLRRMNTNTCLAVLSAPRAQTTRAFQTADSVVLETLMFVLNLSSTVGTSSGPTCMARCSDTNLLLAGPGIWHHGCLRQLQYNSPKHTT